MSGSDVSSGQTSAHLRDIAIEILQRVTREPDQEVSRDQLYQQYFAQDDTVPRSTYDNVVNGLIRHTSPLVDTDGRNDHVRVRALDEVPNYCLDLEQERTDLLDFID